MAEKAVHPLPPYVCPEVAASDVPQLTLAEAIGALSHAFDLAEGQPPGHCIRTCWIGMHIGRTLGIDVPGLSDLYYTLLLKDAGCSSNAARLYERYGSDDRIAKQDFKRVDTDRRGDVLRFVLEHTGTDRGIPDRLGRLFHLARPGKGLAIELTTKRCQRGAEIVRQLGCGEHVAAAVHSLDEHWNGRGWPRGLCAGQIPLGSRIALLAQVVDVFHTVGGPAAAVQEARERVGRWFDPDVVEAFESVADGDFWRGLTASDLATRLQAFEPEPRSVWLDEDGLDTVAEAFASVVDGKSPYTDGHSSRVAIYAASIGSELGLPRGRCRWLRRAALLHDIGKLGVSNAVLDKPEKLTTAEWQQVHLHARYGEEILARIGAFRELAWVAGRHHERLDGKGYPKGLKAPDLTLETRIITVADIFDAMTTRRPYRDALPVTQALAILEKSRGTAVDGRCLDALRAGVPMLDD